MHRRPRCLLTLAVVTRDVPDFALAAGEARRVGGPRRHASSAQAMGVGAVPGPATSMPSMPGDFGIWRRPEGPRCCLRLQGFVPPPTARRDVAAAAVTIQRGGAVAHQVELTGIRRGRCRGRVTRSVPAIPSPPRSCCLARPGLCQARMLGRRCCCSMARGVTSRLPGPTGERPWTLAADADATPR